MLPRMLTTLLLLVCSQSLIAQDIGDPTCDKLLIISGYFSNNVKIYNACDGSFVRDLDSDGYLAGPQAIALDPEGNLVVASETNNRLVRYHRETLTYDAVIMGDRPETQEVEPITVPSPTGLVISPEGRMFVGSFTANNVSEVDPATGSVLNRPVSVARSGVRGPDTGMWLEGNRLLVPGFDSSTIVAADISVAESDKELVATGAGGLNAPRTILKTSEGHLLVTSWRGSRLLEFDGTTGAFRKEVAAVTRPTGMAWESEDVLLVASDANNTIRRIRYSDGAELDAEFINFANGGLQGPTYILVLEKRVSRLAENQGFWLVGVGDIEGNTIQLDDMLFTTGGAFGASFDPDSIGRESWGTITIVFTGCNAADMSWSSADPLFGSGAYSLLRIAADPYGDACVSTGFNAVADNLWMSGHFFGGTPRSGEGFSINLINGGLAVVTWYTYLPSVES